jgi:hypothetical protein
MNMIRGAVSVSTGYPMIRRLAGLFLAFSLIASGYGWASVCPRMVAVGDMQMAFATTHTFVSADESDRATAQPSNCTASTGCTSGCQTAMFPTSGADVAGVRSSPSDPRLTREPRQIERPRIEHPPKPHVSAG